MRRVTAVLVIVFVIVGSTSAPAGAGAPSVTYEPPVEGVIVDPFRPPAGPYSPGNRGIEYEVAAGSPVRAAADGEVIFAGPVAGTLHVTVLHADGLRTTYSFLAGIAVRRGQVVRRGDTIGTTLERFHFGARAPDDTYLDPASLFAGLRIRVRLVPGADEGRPALRSEVASLRSLALSRPHLMAMTRDFALDRLRLLLHYQRELNPATRAARVGAAVAEWNDDRAMCTPTDAVVPPVDERRIAVLVGGLGSTSQSASVDAVDTASLGYDATDVIRFSYRGGRVPDDSDGTGLQRTVANHYESIDTQQDLYASGRRLHALLADVASQNPGVPIDVIAHSQGGVVAALALDEASVGRPRPTEVVSLVTLGSPHEGADLATAAAAADFNPVDREHLVRRLAADHGYDPSSPAIRQLRETSSVSNSGAVSRVAAQIRVTSVAARSDLVVPASRSSVAGEPPVILPLDGITAHADLPGDPLVTREIGLALAGLEPSCRAVSEVVGATVTAESISFATDALGAGLLISDLVGVG